MRILNCAQGTPEWLDARLGLATGSNAKRIMTPATQEFSSQATDYACELIAERMTGARDPWKWEGETADMQRGSLTEDEARKWYQLERDVDVEQVGLCIHDNERWANSPDGLMPPIRRGLELKCPNPKTQVRWLSDGIVPVAHLPQIHHSLIVTGYDSWDFMAYCKCLPPLLLTVTPNAYTEKLRGYLEKFNALYDEMYSRIQEKLLKHVDSVVARNPIEVPRPMQSFVA